MPHTRPHAFYAVVAAHGFKQAAKPGRVILLLGGIGVLGVALFPVPHVINDSNLHTFMATIALGSMCLWPVFSATKEHASPSVLKHRGAWTSTICLAIIGLVFLQAWWTHSHVTGFLERLLITSQIGWLMVALRISHQFGVRASADEAAPTVSPHDNAPDLQVPIPVPM